MTRAIAWAALVAATVLLSWLFLSTGLPSPALFGALVAGIALALAPGPTPVMPTVAVRAGQAVVGVAIGAIVDRDALAPLVQNWLMVALVSIATVALSVGAGQVLRLHRGVSATTATFSSIAGGASGITAMARELDADARVVTVVQYLRVIVVLVSLPIMTTLVFKTASASSSLATTSGDLLRAVAALLICAPVGVALGRLVRLPSAYLLGPLIVTAIVVNVAGGSLEIPRWLEAPGYAIIGAQVGLQFTPASLGAITRMIPLAFASILVVVTGCAAIGFLLTLSGDITPLDAYLATTPGGLFAVLGIAAASEGNVTLVTSMQIARLLVVLLMAPLIAWWLRRLERRP
ncbi:MAG: AbrB family transcriptional regulator [Microbacteriaceae bacterium]